MKLFPNDLLHFDPSAGIAFVYHQDSICALEPPFDLAEAYTIHLEPNESRKVVHFDDEGSLRLYLEFKNWLYVTHTTRDFLTRTLQRPDLIRDRDDLKKHLIEFFEEKAHKDKLSPHLPMCVQIYRTLFGDKLSADNISADYPNLFGNERTPEVSAKTRIMAGIDPFDGSRWTVPAMHEIESRWVNDNRFRDIINWTIFMNKFSGLELSEENRGRINTIMKISQKEAKRLDFIKDGRHQVKEWQKGAKLHR